MTKMDILVQSLEEELWVQKKIKQNPKNFSKKCYYGIWFYYFYIRA